MREVFLGDYIKHRRAELGLTQEQLCQGICGTMTISRMENGRQTPSRSVINALLQRLGLPADRYYALVTKYEMEIDALHREIVSHNVRFQHTVGPERSLVRKEAFDLLRELEAKIEADDNISRQLILRSRVLLGREDGTPYSPAEKLSILMDAIRLTVPNFYADEIGNNLYSLDEVKIINQIAVTYAKNEQYREAIEIFRQLLKYIQKHYQNITQSAGHLPLVAKNYATALVNCNHFYEALEVAALGQDVSLKYGYCQFLPSLIHIMALAHHGLGNDELSKQLYYRSYHLYKAFKDESNISLLQEDARKHYGIEFEN